MTLPSLWKYRSAAIFGAALVFALRTVWFADVVSLLAMLVFLTAHYLDRFFSEERVDSKAMKKVSELEDTLKQLQSDISSLKLVQGIRGNR